MRSTWLGLVLGSMVAAIVIASSCSVDHRSDEYACVSQSQCTGGRLCMQGYCIVPGAIDAARPDGRGSSGSDGGNACPSACTSCNVAQKSCTIDCSVTSCTGTVTCPIGYSCDVKCDTASSCDNGVSCVGATSCTVECSGKASCRNVECGNGPCDVQCSGAQSCRGVSCNTSCSCAVECTGLSSCPAGTVECTSIGCDDGSGCTATPAFCHSC
ncbi:MAG TPA: hypothetical protein VMJ10_08450 [Kofleriaceae bacterium]|nr:hypothetical protein [Kofleriaceae bacterium]